MATVTGLTAARMLLIEAASIVDGVVNGDNLILTRHDGSTINAGSVRGPQGIQGVPGSITVSPAGGALDGNYPDPDLADGAVTTAKIGDGQVTAAKLAPGAGTPEYVIVGKNHDDAASSYPVGVTQFAASAAPDGGLLWPAGTTSHVITHRSSNTSVVQHNVSRDSKAIYVRGVTSDGSAWTSWGKLLDDGDVTAFGQGKAVKHVNVTTNSLGEGANVVRVAHGLTAVPTMIFSTVISHVGTPTVALTPDTGYTATTVDVYMYLVSTGAALASGQTRSVITIAIP